jgi:hypothetical protein
VLKDALEKARRKSPPGPVEAPPRHRDGAARPLAFGQRTGLPDGTPEGPTLTSTHAKEEMMKKHLVTLLFAVAVAAIPARAAWAQGNAADMTDMQALRTAVRTDKKAFVASVMKLTDAEAKKFWPAYDAYQRTLDMTTREKNVTLEGVIAQDKPVSDPYAKQIAKDLISAEETEVKARRTLYNRMIKAVPPKKALRYLQLEGKIRAVQAYDIAQVMPLVK